MATDGNELDMARLQWRCRRGTLELDLMVSRFLKHAYQSAATRHQYAFRRLLEYPDDILIDLLTGKVLAEDRDIADVVEQIRYTDFTSPRPL